MRNPLRICCGILLLLTAACAANEAAAPAAQPATQPATQSAEPARPVIRLWDKAVPDAVGTADADVPTLTVFAVNAATRPSSALIVCPGGSYMHLSVHEGPPVAERFNTFGIYTFVLKSRLGPTYHHPVEMHDIQRAIRLVRFHAAEWNIDPQHIGVLGFSAGGHLVSTAATHFDIGNPDAPDPIDRVSCRPDVAILIYPVITMMDPFAHLLSRRNLLGEHFDPAIQTFMSSELQVTPQTPPCFLVSTSDDHTAQVENSLLFAMACHKNKVPVELHVFEHGKHGFDMGKGDPILSTWPHLAQLWLAKHGFGQ